MAGKIETVARRSNMSFNDMLDYYEGLANSEYKNNFYLFLSRALKACNVWAGEVDGNIVRHAYLLKVQMNDADLPDEVLDVPAPHITPRKRRAKVATAVAQ